MIYVAFEYKIKNTTISSNKILNNTFDKIFHQGVLFENVTLNATGHNIFYDVGNDFNGTNYPSQWPDDATFAAGWNEFRRWWHWK